jgi:hypothetical protein
MGSFATAVQSRLCERLATLRPRFDWGTEYRIASTPVDIAGHATDHTALVELEWRRADPADNTAKLFRHLSDGALAADRIDVFQVFTSYYDLADGAVSSKRRNAEFVGRVAADTLDALSYHAIEFVLSPPKRGAERPDGWRAAADTTADRITVQLSAASV